MLFRSDFYYRIAKLLPERFSVCAGVLRTEERAKEVAHKEGVFATSDLDQALERKPDFAVLCVPRDVTKDYLVKLMKKGIPVLCETPPGKNVEELKELWVQDTKSFFRRNRTFECEVSEMQECPYLKSRLLKGVLPV